MMFRTESDAAQFDSRVEQCLKILRATDGLTLSDCAQVQAQLPTGTAELVAVEIMMAEFVGMTPNGREDTFTRTVYAVAASLRKSCPTVAELRHALGQTTGNSPIVTVLALQRVLQELEAS